LNRETPAIDQILVERSGQTAVVTLNRPRSGNAINAYMFDKLRAVFDELDADPRVRAVVLTGAGDEIFCAGGDLKEFIPTLGDGDLSSVIPDPAKRFLSETYTPIIAAVNGACIAGGMELLLGTDVRIAADHATFLTPETRLGLMGAQGTVTRLARQVPWAIAMEMLLAGTTIDADRAAQVGLVNRSVPAGALMDEAMRMAERICASSPLAVRSTKEVVLRAAAMEEPFRIEAALAERVFRSEDAKEGLSSFVERRTPQFRDELE